MDDTRGGTGALKAVGHQWYWSYEDAAGDYDRYMVKDAPRNLVTDSTPLVGAGQATNLIATSADVIHRWAVPALAVKVDSIPGRLNTMQLLTPKAGVLYGQCSEICGANHAFMPIRLEIV